MKTVRYTRFGGPEVLTLVDQSSPVPRKGQLGIRVHAVSINPMDGKIRRGQAKLLSGRRFPKTPGLDFAGVVEALGPEVAGFALGDRVFGALGSLKEGYLAESIAVSARVVSKLPDAIDDVAGAAAAVVGLTATQALYDVARLEQGARVLVHGASGGVGLFALQLAKLRGAHVTGVSSARGLEIVRGYGADVVLDYRTQPIASAGLTFDVALDPSTNLAFSAAQRLLSPSGVYVGFEPSPLALAESALSNLVRGKQQHYVIMKSSTARLDELARQLASGALRGPPTEVFALADFRRAFEVAERGVVGKVVIDLR